MTKMISAKEKHQIASAVRVCLQDNHTDISKVSFVEFDKTWYEWSQARLSYQVELPYYPKLSLKVAKEIYRMAIKQHKS